MGAITKTGTPSLCSRPRDNTFQLDLAYTGEAITAGDACYIRESNGKVYKSAIVTTHNTNGKVHGFAAQTLPAGKAITLYQEGRFQYSDDLVAGDTYYLNESVAGGITDTVGSYATKPLGLGLAGGKLQLKANWFLY